MADTSTLRLRIFDGSRQLFSKPTDFLVKIVADPARLGKTSRAVFQIRGRGQSECSWSRGADLN
jgi:hypothetical protein